jgi:hypothetical protein
MRVEPIWVHDRVETLGTSVADKGSFISRFLYKVLEIVGAAVATAVSGYFVAHLGGFLPSQTHPSTPPTVAVAPTERPVAKSIPANLPAKEPTATAQPTQSVAAPAAAEAPDHRPSQTPQEAAGSPAPTAPKSANSRTAAKPPRNKSAKPETVATPDTSRSREAVEAKARETAEPKPQPRQADDKDSVEAQVKAALANVDNHAPPADVRHDNPATQSRPTDVAPNTTAAIPARPLEPPQAAPGPVGQPRSVDLGSPVQQPATPQPATTQPVPAVAAPVQIAPVQPTPPQQPDALTSVEIKSRPIATIDTPAASEAAPPQEEEKGVLSIFKRILPDLRRPASTDEAPRPPAPVGQ